MNFRIFLEKAEIDKDLEKTLKSIPKSHSDLIKGYEFKWEPGSTLKHDSEHIGVIDSTRKTITIASPWNYGRQFTLLHEIGHAVWERLMPKRLKDAWKSIARRTKPKVAAEDKESAKENPEELFCHAYATYYSRNPIVKFDHPEWQKFIEKLK